MQHSIFEPLYSLQAHNMAGYCLQAPMPAFPSAHAPSLFSISPPSPPPPFHAFNRETSLHAHILPPGSGQDFTSHLTHSLSHPSLSPTPPPPSSIHGNSAHSKLPLSHSITFFTPRSPSPPACSNSDDDRKCDDGSVASRLLSSITKSISSPSLHLTSCKEATRETPYQKTLKLKQMKLQHCAEALGMESSDSSSLLYDSQCIHQEEIGMQGKPSSCLPHSHQESSLRSVKSAPNLSPAPPLMTNQANHSRYTRSTSFPPPLSHTLPTSSSFDSPSISLRAYREEGRLILKETMVPSKHYLHANRRNGRLTLHVLTREAEEVESFDRQGAHEEFSNKLDSEGTNLLQEAIVECMQVSLYEETGEEGFDNKEEDSCKMQTLDEEVCVKKSLGMDTSKEINTAASHVNMSLHRLNCIAIHNKKKDDKRNLISNVITLSLQTSSHSKVTLHKAQVLSFPNLSSYPLVSVDSLKQSALIHSAERTHRFLSSNHEYRSTFPQSNENFFWESNLMPRAVASGSPRKAGSGSDSGGGGGGGAAVPAFVMEDMGAKSLMKVVSELATSLILEASYGGGNWCLAGKRKPLLSGVERGESGTIIGGAIGHGEEGQVSHDTNFGYNTNCEEEKANNTSIEGGSTELNITPSPLNLGLQFPSSNASEEWLHTLHCKELFHRHQLGQGFMKLHCIPTRS